MTMSETKTKKPQAGEWWQTRGGERRYIAGRQPDCTVSAYPLIAVNNNEMSVELTDDGRYCHDVQSSEDLVQHLPGCDSWDWVEPVEPPFPRYFVYVGTDVCFWDFVKATEWGTNPMKHEGGIMCPFGGIVCRKDVEDWVKRGLWKEITEAESEALKGIEPAVETWPAVEPQPKQIKIFIPLRALSEPESDWPVRCSLTGIKDVASWIEIKCPFFGML